MFSLKSLNIYFILLITNSTIIVFFSYCIDAVRVNVKFATNMEVAESVTTLLHTVADRHGGRKRRMKE
jgi:hypothetical protein